MNQPNQTLNDRDRFIINVFGTIPDETLSPVQTQKLFFLLEKRLGRNYFDFKPYHYGPYDKNLTDTLTMLYCNGLIQIKNINGINHYQLNKDCSSITENFFNENEKNFIKDLISFIKNLSFRQLCMSIYKEFPEMSVNSVFFGK